MDKVWEIKDPDTYLRKKRPQGERPAPSEQKDPAKAYSLSMLWWGSGQLYNDQLGKGAAFFISAMVLLFTAGLLAVYRVSALQFLRDRGASIANAFLFSELLLFLAILFWAFNAADAYRHAARTRSTRFRGVPSSVTPLLASLASPGWGQFLNGQPFKGSIYAALAVLGSFAVLTVFLSLLFWPVLEPSDSRVMVEELFVLCALMLPFVPLLWAFSAHDAFKVSRDDLLKEPLWERMKAAYYRARTQGWVRGLFPQIRGTFLLVLVLAFFVVVVHYWSPLGFYAKLLASAHEFTRNRGMTIAPEIITEIMARLPIAVQ
jgi:TM2 domain-containing membrane protein YozV